MRATAPPAVRGPVCVCWVGHTFYYKFVCMSKGHTRPTSAWHIIKIYILQLNYNSDGLDRSHDYISNRIKQMYQGSNRITWMYSLIHPKGSTQ